MLRRRLLAVSVAVGGVGHVLASFPPADLVTAALFAMSLTCLPCAWHLWRYDSHRVVAGSTYLAILMSVVHAAIIGSMYPSTAGHGTPHSSHTLTVMSTLTLLEIGVVLGGIHILLTPVDARRSTESPRHVGRL